MTARRDICEEDGFSMIEVVAAAAIAVVTVLAISSTLVKGMFNSAGHQRQAAAFVIAQREVENVRAIVARYGFDALAMSSQPGSPTSVTLPVNPDNPNDFITGSGTSSAAFRIMESFHDTTRGVATGTPANGERLCVGGTLPCLTAGQVAPLSTNQTSGAVSATVYRYVTRRTEPVCATAGACDGDSRRVIIAVVPTTSGTGELQAKKPVYATVTISNPVPSDEPATPGAGLRIGVNIG
jgi:hypothetical protein